MPRHKLWSDDDPDWHPADDDPGWAPIAGPHAEYEFSDEEVPGGGDRWSTWDRSGPAERGPEPRPDWLVTELAAVDVEYGVLTGCAGTSCSGCGTRRSSCSPSWPPRAWPTATCPRSTCSCTAGGW